MVLNQNAGLSGTLPEAVPLWRKLLEATAINETRLALIRFYSALKKILSGSTWLTNL